MSCGENLEEGNLINQKLQLTFERVTPEQKTLLQVAGLISSLDKASAKIFDSLLLDKVDIIFSVGKDVIPETGEVGWAWPNRVRITVDPSHKAGVEFIVEKRLPKTLAHELHHVARMTKFGHPKTLLEALISEGLADHFADSLYPEPKSPWTDALSGPEIEGAWEKAKPTLNKRYNHVEWFFGKGKIPRWAGYTIGYRLVGDAIKKLEKPAAELVDTPAEEIFKAGG